MPSTTNSDNKRFYLDVSQPNLYRQPQNPDAKLWRYMDLPRFVSLLDKKALYLARPIDFEDPWEGGVSSLTKKDRERLEQRAARPTQCRHRIDEGTRCPDVAVQGSNRCAQHGGQEYVPPPRSETSEIIRASAGVSCWHMNEHESEAMWTAYEKKGVAIQTSYRKLSAEFDPYPSRQEPPPTDVAGTLLLGVVQYEDYDNEKTRIPEYESILPLFYKRSSFTHEKEVRLVLSRYWKGLTAARGIDLSKASAADIPGLKGVPVPIRLEHLVEEIIVDPRQPPWVVDAIKAVTAKFCPPLGDRVRRSNLLDPPSRH